MHHHPSFWGSSPCHNCPKSQPAPNPPGQQKIFLQEVSLTYPQVRGLPGPYRQYIINEIIRRQAQSILPPPDPEQNIVSAASQYDLELLENNVLSLRFENYFYPEYYAHGMSYVTSVNLNLVTCQVYDLPNLFKPGSNYQRRLTAIIEEQIKEQDIPLINEFTGITGNENFYLTPDSLVIYYQIYEFTPYYYGILEFSIPYDDIADLIDPNGPIGGLV